MHPLEQLLASTQFWNDALIALIGGGGVGGVISALAARRKTNAETQQAQSQADKLTSDAAKQAVDILTQNVIQPLRDQVENQSEQIDALEKDQRTFFKAVTYIRALCHWLDPAVTAIEPEYMAAHPKPSLPNDLRGEVGISE